jgi:SanA protein
VSQTVHRLKLVLISVAILLAAMIWTVDYMVNANTAGQIYSDLSKIPANRVGLLLGTSKFTDKAKNIINQYYQNRIDATVALFMAGKIDYIIVSGDNSLKYYNEPELMRNDLIARGVPADKIFMDFAGFRTLDSILRCRDIFGQHKFTIISQEFHNKRAVYIGNHKNTEVIAFNAKDGDAFWIANLREKVARTRMMIDLVINTRAKYYGTSIEIK